MIAARIGEPPEGPGGPAEELRHGCRLNRGARCRRRLLVPIRLLGGRVAEGLHVDPRRGAGTASAPEPEA